VRNSLFAFVVLAAFGFGFDAATLPAAFADDGPPKAGQLDKKSQAILNEMDKLLKEAGADKRKLCASGQAPEWVSSQRARYGASVPFADASDMCVGTLQSTATDGHLGDLYREVLVRLGGDVANSAKWPRVIGAAVLDDKADVPIGNHKSARMTPALAFDAGFTVAFQDGSAAKSQDADLAQLKALAESCLGQHHDAGTCYSAGYVYGTQAFKARGMPAH
jgi:hypothetical protein